MYGVTLIVYQSGQGHWSFLVGLSVELQKVHHLRESTSKCRKF